MSHFTVPHRTPLLKKGVSFHGTFRAEKNSLCFNPLKVLPYHCRIPSSAQAKSRKPYSLLVGCAASMLASLLAGGRCCFRAGLPFAGLGCLLVSSLRGRLVSLVTFLPVGLLEGILRCKLCRLLVLCLAFWLRFLSAGGSCAQAVCRTRTQQGGRAVCRLNRHA